MADPLVNRSQAILRVPVDMVSAEVELADGERFEAMLFVPTGHEVGRLLTEASAFVPMVRTGRVCLVGRAAIATVRVSSPISDLGDDLPLLEQRVTVKLRSGITHEGTLTWIDTSGRKRTSDYLNNPEPTFELRAGEALYVVVKAHVSTVQEC